MNTVKQQICTSVNGRRYVLLFLQYDSEENITQTFRLGLIADDGIDGAGEPWGQENMNHSNCSRRDSLKRLSGSTKPIISEVQSKQVPTNGALNHNV